MGKLFGVAENRSVGWGCKWDRDMLDYEQEKTTVGNKTNGISAPTDVPSCSPKRSKRREIHHIRETAKTPNNELAWRDVPSLISPADAVSPGLRPSKSVKSCLHAWCVR